MVDDTLAGLTRLGAFARARFTGRVAAITGSVGKTTTKEMLRAALTPFGAGHAAVASYNNHWGVPPDPGAHAPGPPARTSRLLRHRNRHEPRR